MLIETIVNNVVKPINLNEFKNVSNRVIIVGPSGSGKTYLFTKIIYPHIKQLFHIIHVITIEKNRKKYEDMIPKDLIMFENINGKKKAVPFPKLFITISENPHTIVSMIAKIKEFQDETKKKYNILLIYDDIYSEKLKDYPQFIQQFTNFRENNISVYFLIQTLTKVFSQTILENLSHIVFFRSNSTYFQNMSKSRFIEEAVNKFWSGYYSDRKNKGLDVKPLLTKNELEQIVDIVYANNLFLDQHSALVYNFDKSELYKIEPKK